jgi:hypothetical protein
MEKKRKTPGIQNKTHSGGLTVMFWGCISNEGKGTLTVIDGTMDGKSISRF